MNKQLIMGFIIFCGGLFGLSMKQLTGVEFEVKSYLFGVLLGIFITAYWVA